MGHLHVLMTIAFVLRGSDTGDGEVIIIEQPAQHAYRVLIRDASGAREINTGAAAASDGERRIHDAIAAGDWNALMRLLRQHELDALERDLGIVSGK